ncbi:MAG: GNAT family N-acetyltransferase [Pseudomonadota bacterium]
MRTSDIITMQIDLADDQIPIRSFPEGAHLVPFDPATHRRLARDLLNLAYQHGGGDIRSTEAWWSELVEDAEYEQALLFAVMAHHSNTMIAFAQVWSSGFIKDFAVHPKHQRTGLGSALLSHVFQVLFARGLKHSSLKVRSDNPSNAAAFYQALGMSSLATSHRENGGLG